MSYFGPDPGDLTPDEMYDRAPRIGFRVTYSRDLAQYIVVRGDCALCAQGHTRFTECGEHMVFNRQEAHGGNSYRVQPCERMRVVPSLAHRGDDGAERAQHVCETLNRVYTQTETA